MRRALLVLALALGAVGLFAGGLAWVLNDPRPPAQAPRAQRLYYAFCVGCHGVNGRGSWRAALFLIRPGDLTRARAEPEQYLFDLIKHGGAAIGRPGMPAFGAQLGDEDIRELVAYVRTLP
ncbi:MAG TPA: cytochrome c [Methylomirabilota bacterium]|nr:cytochrome c [Methylomirabilota bacterium]